MFAIILLMAAAFPAAAPPTIVLVGKITDDKGVPIAGTELVLADGAVIMGTQPAVLDRGRTDDAGRFCLHIPVEPIDQYGPRSWLVLWAHKPGMRIGMRLIPRDWPPEGEPLELVLRPANRLAMRVAGPEGKPIRGARVTGARALGRPLPQPLAEAVRAETDADGMATLNAFAPDELDVVSVSAHGVGSQQLALPGAQAMGVRSLHLAPVGRVEGRILAEDPKAVRGLTIYARTWADPSDAPDKRIYRVRDTPGFGGVAETVTDADGRFVLPELAEGTLNLTFVPRQDLPFRGTWDSHPDVTAKETTRVEIPLKRGVKVNGVVREMGTGKPIEGAAVRIEFGLGAPRARTDAAGRYVGYVTIQSVAPYVPAPPKPYFYARELLDSEPIPAGATEVTPRPFLLTRGASLHGCVVDSQGRPVPAAAVAATWPLPSGGDVIARAWTDRHGKFVLEAVDPKAELSMTAQRRGAETAGGIRARAEQTEAITLKISDTHAVDLRGRVVDVANRPVAGAAIRIISALRDKQRGYYSSENLVQFGDGDILRSDADGRFSSPRWLRPDLHYRAEVEAPGFVPVLTEWLQPVGGKTLAIADVVLLSAPSARLVEGLVVDRQGHPVAGATVFQSGDGPRRTRTDSDKEGRFRLPGVYDGDAFLFVDKAGFRPRGHSVRADGMPVVLTLDPVNGTLANPLSVLPAVMPREEEKTLARRLLEPLMKNFAGGEPGSTQYRLVDVMARVDPSRALALADQGAFTDAQFNTWLRYNAAQGLLEESPQEALAVAETINEPGLRAQIYVLASDQLSPGERLRKEELLDTALLYARSDSDAVQKLDALGRIALRWLELNETERARQILREGQAYATGAPAPGASNQGTNAVHARGRFAAKLARIDAKAALAMALGYRDPYHDWYVGGVALGLAETDPAQAELVEQKLHYDYLSNGRTVRLCGRMAVKDLDRARALAGRLTTSSLRLGALVAMARNLVKSDPLRAEALIREAFVACEKEAKEGSDGQWSYQSTCLQAAGLLTLAEQTGPEFLEECFWKVLALRPQRPSRGDPTGQFEGVIGKLALLLVRYDRAVARSILEPAAGRLRTLLRTDQSGDAQAILLAATMIDPHWAVTLVNTLPDAPAGTQDSAKDAARRLVATILVRGVQERWNFIFESYVYGMRDSKDEER